MDDTNFIKNSQNMQEEISTWLKISILLMFITMFTLTFITIRQWLKIKIINREMCQKSIKIKNLDRIVKKKNTLTKQKKTLDTQSEVIHKLKGKPKYKIALITQIFKLLPPKTKIKTVSIKKTNLDLSIQCPNEKIANWIVQKISNLPDIKTLKLASIQKKTTQFIYNIKGTLGDILTVMNYRAS